MKCQSASISIFGAWHVRRNRVSSGTLRVTDVSIQPLCQSSGRHTGSTANTITENDLNQPTHTIPSREEILGIFRDAQSPLDAAALARALNVDPDAVEVLSRRLNAMQRDGQIHSNQAGIFELADHSSFVAGKVSAHRDGFGFVIPDEPGEDETRVMPRG